MEFQQAYYVKKFALTNCSGIIVLDEFPGNYFAIWTSKNSLEWQADLYHPDCGSSSFGTLLKLKSFTLPFLHFTLLSLVLILIMHFGFLALVILKFLGFSVYHYTVMIIPDLLNLNGLIILLCYCFIKLSINLFWFVVFGQEPGNKHKF